jgi:hypothetical protein
MTIIQLIILLVSVFIIGVLAGLDLNNIRTDYETIRVCPKLNFDECMELDGIPYFSNDPTITEIQDCEFIK